MKVFILALSAVLSASAFAAGGTGNVGSATQPAQQLKVRMSCRGVNRPGQIQIVEDLQTGLMKMEIIDKGDPKPSAVIDINRVTWIPAATSYEGIGTLTVSSQDQSAQFEMIGQPEVSLTCSK